MCALSVFSVLSACVWCFVECVERVECVWSVCVCVCVCSDAV